MNAALLRSAVLLGIVLAAGCASRAPIAEAPWPRQSAPQVVQAEIPVAAEPVAKPPEPIKACANCPTPDPDFAPTFEEVPIGIENTPDAVVVDEPTSRYGNAQTYSVLGQQYTVMPKVPKGFKQDGRASWYGKKFHGRRTANGESYDMFKMTAAHKTLPIPSYVRVTSKANGRSVVVRVNDRGPFHPGRIIDLSYAAAARLDMLHAGSVEVRLESLTPQQGRNATETGQGKPRYLEVGRFADAIEAVSLREKLSRLGFRDTELLQTGTASGDGVESILRIGPFSSFSKLEAARVKLGLKEIAAFPVAD